MKICPNCGCRLNPHLNKRHYISKKEKEIFIKRYENLLENGIVTDKLVKLARFELSYSDKTNDVDIRMSLNNVIRRNRF